MAAIIAKTICTPAELQDMETLVDINEKIKTLESQKKVLSDKIKANMINLKVDKVDVNGSTLSIIESTRTTVSKATKDEFIAQLVGLGKKHLVVTSIEPDVEGIFAEVGAGTLQKDFVDKYVKVTPVTTLRCN